MIRRKRLVQRGATKAPLRIRYAEPPLWSGAVSLKPTLHGGHVWRLPEDLGFASGLSALPLTLSEGLHAAAFLPLALTTDKVPRPMILLAAGPDMPSPLVADGRLAGRHMPMILRFYPFLPLRDPQERDLVVAGDMGGGHLLQGRAGAGWLPVFDDTGELAPEAARRVQGLAAWQAGRDAALAAAGALARAGVLCTARGLAEGWQTVDPALLAALPSERVAAMHASGALALAHALITGAGHWPKLHTGQSRPMTADKAGQDFLQAFGRAQADDGYVLPFGADRA